MNPQIRAAIAEDHELVKKGFVSLLNKYCPELDIVFEANNGRELLKYLKTDLPDIILLDIEMPGMSGIRLIEIIKSKYSSVKIIVVSAHNEITSIMEYVNKGADSFLPKNCGIKELLSTIHKVYTEGVYYNEHLSKELAKNGVMIPGTNRGKKLTERDILFIECLIENRSDDEIAVLMNIKGEAVTRYKRRLLLKTNSTDIKGLLKYVKERKLI